MVGRQDQRGAEEGARAAGTRQASASCSWTGAARGAAPSPRPSAAAARARRCRASPSDPRPSSDDRALRPPAAARGSGRPARAWPRRARRGAAPWSWRQVVGGERLVVAVPQQAGDLLERGGARERRGVEAAVVKTVVLDQGQRRFENRRAEVERVVGDRLRPCGRRRGGVSAARCRRRGSAARGDRRSPRSAADRGSHRRRASPPTRRGVAPPPGNSAIRSSCIILINIIKIDNIYRQSDVGGDTGKECQCCRHGWIAASTASSWPTR